MPLAPLGTRGYTDWQRIANYDSDEVWREHPGIINTDLVSPVIDCSRYAYLGGKLGPMVGTMVVEITWYLDSAATIQLGSRRFTISSVSPTGAQIRLPNLGPFVQLSVSPLPAGNYGPSIDLFLTNRVHPLEFIPSEPVLIDNQGGALPASATETIYPNDYYAGPVRVWFNAANSNSYVTLQYLTDGNVWDDLDQRLLTTNQNTYDMVTPSGVWRVLVTNNTAVATVYFLAVTPSTTGAT